MAITADTAHTCHAGPLCAIALHDCPREAFMDDPITVAYGVGNEMLHLISCAVCDATPGQAGFCPHASCREIEMEECHACYYAAMSDDSLPTWPRFQFGATS